MYCCGPTVYGPAHIGNFRTFLAQDVLRRTLECAGYNVKHVRNITDVDDKTIRESQKQGLSLKEFTSRWEDKFHSDCKKLNMLPPTVEPRATEHIKEQLEMVQKLVDKGFAYPTKDGSVYFKISAFPEYGQLTGLDFEHMATQSTNSAGEANNADEYDRENVADFALWKGRKPEDGPNFWKSPWGEGRPGWHIECSAMSSKYLGDTFDLHGGGIDLCFPHHENEIAQSQCATGKSPYVRYWFHSAHLMVEGQKMSKSLGNLYTLDQLVEKGYTPAQIRYALISGHYRQQLNFTFKGLDDAKSAMSKMKKGLDAAMEKTGVSEDEFKAYIKPANAFANTVFEGAWKALIDDINVRGKLRAYEFVISQLRGENDNVIFAGMMKVDHYDATERRLYLDTEEGVLYNPFRSGDILMVQRFGGMPTAENDYNVIKQYELRVDEAGIGNLSDGEKRLDWITFTNFVGDISDIAGGDVLTRVDSVADSTRKGIVKVTTIDEIGAPYIDVVYGMKTDPENATRARMGNLTGIRTKHGIDLTGVWGIYGSGAYFENSTYILDNGNTIEQQFTIINGTLESTIGELRNDMSLEPGNILRNSSFSRDTNYWETGGTVNLWAFNGQFIYANDTFISEKDDFAGIYQDGSRNVLRIRNSYVLQRNDVMDIPVREEGDEDWTYSFSFFYKVLQAGTLTAGFSGSALYLSQQLQPTDEYQKLSKVADWNEQGDFRLSFTGEILIYGVSLFNDALADAVIHLQTQITQNSEKIALTATKDYVDAETGKIYEKYNSELSVMADQIDLRVTQTTFEEGTNAIKTELESQINVQAGSISALSTKVDNINNRIDSAGWVTTSQGNTLWASSDLEDGNKIISYINQTATTTTIKSSRVNLQGAVSFSMLSDYTSVNNRINSKADLDDITNEIHNYINSSDFDDEVDNALAGKLSNYVTSSILSDRLAEYATQDYAGRAAELAFEELADALVHGETTVLGGFINANIISVDTAFADKIFANMAEIGGFKIHDLGFEGVKDGNYIMITSPNQNGYTMICNNADSYIAVYTGDSMNGITSTSEGPGYALRTVGKIQFNDLGTATASSTWKQLLVNTSTGEVRRAS